MKPYSKVLPENKFKGKSSPFSNLHRTIFCLVLSKNSLDINTFFRKQNLCNFASKVNVS